MRFKDTQQPEIIPTRWVLMRTPAGHIAVFAGINNVIFIGRELGRLVCNVNDTLSASRLCRQGTQISSRLSKVRSKYETRWRWRWTVRIRQV